MKKIVNEETHKEKEIQLLAAYVHGALTALHGLGAVYNLKRKNWSAAFIHTAVGLWDCVATMQHINKTKK